ncbi:hypothetical protein [Streptomyces sp. NPDC007856]|uniref:hypothetical protein n=1 Tax=Streptomyces sp. NPDC007856 TaxID=3364781 RepID=UPI0036A8C7D3
MPGTVLLLAASPVGRGRLVEAAGVLPVLAAVAPAVLSGTDTANVVELADPLEPQAVLTRLRAAAAAPGPLTLYIAGQLQLDRRQRLPHLALARTTAATVRYTGLPWHWIREELRLRSAVDTALVVDLHADAEAWRYVAERGLDCGANAAVYGRVAPVGGRRGVAEPGYMKAVATLLRSGYRPPLLQLHEQALGRIAEASAGRDLVLAVPGGTVPRPPFAHPPTGFGQPEGQAPTAPATSPAPHATGQTPPAPGTRQAPPTLTTNQAPPAPGTRQVPPALAAKQALPAPALSHAPDAVKQVPSGAKSAPFAGRQDPPGAKSAPFAGRQDPSGAKSAPYAGRQDPPGAKQSPLAPSHALDATKQAPPATALSHAPDAVKQVPSGAKPAPHAVKQPPLAPNHTPHAPNHTPHTLAPPTGVTGPDPHAVISAAVQGGRHGDADVLAAQQEEVAVRVHGPGSDEALHWAEVRADLAMFAGDAVRSCRAWLAVAEVRLAAGQAVDAPAVEAAVDRAHHQWGRITDPTRARELGPALAELRLRVPGRRQGALENVRRQLRQLQAVQ